MKAHLLFILVLIGLCGCSQNQFKFEGKIYWLEGTDSYIQLLNNDSLRFYSTGHVGESEWNLNFGSWKTVGDSLLILEVKYDEIDEEPSQFTLLVDKKEKYLYDKEHMYAFVRKRSVEIEGLILKEY